MKKTARFVTIMLVAAFMLASCSKHIHKVGSGSQGKGQVEERQWFALWGLVPLNDVDTNQMAGSETNYVIETKQSGLDIVMNIFTGSVSIYSRTVTVKK